MMCIVFIVCFTCTTMILVDCFLQTKNGIKYDDLVKAIYILDGHFETMFSQKYVMEFICGMCSSFGDR